MAGNNRFKFLLEQRTFLVYKYFHEHGDYDSILGEFAIRFPNTPVPCCQMVWKLKNKFKQTGSVADAPRAGRPRSI